MECFFFFFRQLTYYTLYKREEKNIIFHRTQIEINSKNSAFEMFIIFCKPCKNIQRGNHGS